MLTGWLALQQHLACQAPAGRTQAQILPFSAGWHLQLAGWDRLLPAPAISWILWSSCYSNIGHDHSSIVHDGLEAMREI